MGRRGARTRGAKRLQCYFGASDVQRFQHHAPIGDGEHDAPRHYVLDRATDVTWLFLRAFVHLSTDQLTTDALFARLSVFNDVALGNFLPVALLLERLELLLADLYVPSNSISRSCHGSLLTAVPPRYDRVLISSHFLSD